jgi:hypothetical protein
MAALSHFLDILFNKPIHINTLPWSDPRSVIILRFLKAEYARGRLFGTGFTAKEIAAVPLRGR